MYFNEMEAVEIVENQKIKRFDINNIQKIYVTYTYFLFYKKYHLKIKTKDGFSHTININKKDKSKIKRQVSLLRIVKNWTKNHQQYNLEFS